MEQVIREAHEMCSLNIIRGYPLWKQTNIARDGTDQEKANVADWIGLNKTRLSAYEDEIRASEEPEEIDLSEDWPDPKAFKAMLLADKVITDMESAKGKLDNARFRFNVATLQDEFDAERDADLHATDQRLSDEFDDLEARLDKVEPEGLDRHTYLNGKLFGKGR